MSLKRYLFDGSSLSITDRVELETILNDWAHTGCQCIDIEKGLYKGDFNENEDISELPFPNGTVITPMT